MKARNWMGSLVFLAVATFWLQFGPVEYAAGVGCNQSVFTFH